MTGVDEIYSFVFKGLLAEDSLDSVGRSHNYSGNKLLDSPTFDRLSIDLLDQDLIKDVSNMAIVYIAIAGFEKSVRKLITTLLLEQVGENWWSVSVPQKVREKAETRRAEEAKIRWHTPRGDDPINYSELGDLITIINQNWDKFEPFIRSLEWAKQLITTVERSRNVIMHSGTLENGDIERLGMQIRDWIKQVGS